MKRILKFILLLTITLLLPKNIVKAETIDGISNNSIKLLAYSYPWDFKQEWVEFKFVPQGNGTAKLKYYSNGKILNPSDVNPNLTLYSATHLSTSNIYGYQKNILFKRGQKMYNVAEILESFIFTYGADDFQLRPLVLLYPVVPPLGRSTEDSQSNYNMIYDEGFSGVKIEGPILSNLGNRDVNDDLRFSKRSDLYKFRVEKEGLHAQYKYQVKIPDGEYVIETYEDTSKSVQANGSNVEIGDYIGLNTQKWRFEYDNVRKAYKIKSNIGVLSLANKVGADVICRLDKNENDQFWYIEDAGNGNYRLINASNVTDRLNLDANNKNISIADNRNNNKQLFKIVSYNKEQALTYGEWKIVSKLNDNKVLNLHIGGNPNTNVTIWDNANVPQQKWMFQYNSYKNAFNIRNYHNYGCLAWDLNSNKNVHALGIVESDNYYWQLEDVGNGYFVIKNCHDPNMVLELSNSNTSNSSNIQVGKRTDKDNQKWKLVR